MAFEAIVKKQIEKLRAPSIKCADMVVNELTSVIRKCSEKVIIIVLNLSNSFSCL